MSVRNLAPRNKAFICPVCGKTFEDEETLNAHKERDHSISTKSQASVG
ncbi:MAG: C2H2-type zinc finger protein [Nitrososphaeraceae archaeon]